MVALIVGVLFIGFAVIAVIPGNFWHVWLGTTGNHDPKKALPPS